MVHYDVTLPDLEHRERGPYTFVQWLVPRTSSVRTGTALAIVDGRTRKYLLRNVGVDIFKPWKIAAGDKLEPGQIIGTITTDPDEVPSANPYLTFSVMKSDQL